MARREIVEVKKEKAVSLVSLSLFHFSLVAREMATDSGREYFD